jgi:hypothetical protein
MRNRVGAIGATVLGFALALSGGGVASAKSESAAGPAAKSVDDYHELQVLHSGKCLDMDISGNNAFRNGAKVQQWDCLGGTNQLWKVVYNDASHVWFTLHVRHSEKCLDIDVSNAGGQTNGAKAQQWDCNGGGNQNFRMMATDIPGYVKLAVQHSGKCLDEDISGDNGFRNGGKVQQWACDGGSNQFWRILP